MKKSKIITIAGFIISILLLYLSLKDIKFQAILMTFKKADYRFVLLPLIFIFVSATLCAFKWSKIAGSGVRFRETFVALVIGLFVNNVLPARLGEVARGYVLSKKKGLSFTYSFSTVLVDRFFDLIGLLILLFLFFPKHRLPLKVSQGIYILVAFLIICIIIMFIMSRENVANTLAGRLVKIERPFLSRVAKRIVEIQENLKRIHSPINFIYFICIAFLQWLSMSTALYFAMLTLDIPIKFVYVPFVCALLNMGISIPSSPGYLGIYQFLLVYLLAIFNVPKYEGFAVSMLFHASWYIPYNILGFAFLLKEHLKIREIRKLEEKNDSE